MEILMLIAVVIGEYFFLRSIWKYEVRLARASAKK